MCIHQYRGMGRTLQTMCEKLQRLLEGRLSGMSCDRNKCYKQDYNGGSCEECMKDALHDYCCELECEEHEFEEDAKNQVNRNELVDRQRTI